MALKILINGAGVAGPALAAMLLSSPSRAYAITVVERAPSLRTGGQQVDLRAQGIPIMKRMGLLPTIKARCVAEDGLMLVDSRGETKAVLRKNDTGDGPQGLTSEYEIMRGELVSVLYRRSLEAARGAGAGGQGKALSYEFGKFATGMRQRGGGDGGVGVTFSDGTEADFDLVVGADGIGSRTRRLAFGEEDSRSTFRSLGVYSALFNIPRDPAEDQPLMAKMCHLPGRRVIATRTGDQPLTQVSLSTMNPSRKLLESMSGTVEDQKAAWAEAFKGAGWKVDQFLEAMMNKSDFFYVSESAQMKMDQWHKGRVVLLGDAGYCPSPNSGMGTTAALVGSYVLAGELEKHGRNVGAALEGYESMLRPFIAEVQKLVPGMPKLFFYDTQMGVWLLHQFLGAFTGLKVDKLLYKLLPEANGDWDVPNYPGLRLHV